MRAPVTAVAAALLSLVVTISAPAAARTWSVSDLVGQPNPTPTPASPTPSRNWNLTEMFASPEAAATVRAAAAARIPELNGCRGRLGESEAELERCLDLRFDIDHQLMTVYVYAFVYRDLDLRNAAAEKLKAETAQAQVQLATTAAFMEPELVALGADRIEAMIVAEPGLAPYAVLLRELVRMAPHTLPAPQEELLAGAGAFSGKFSDVYDQLTVADIPYPTVEIPGAGPARLDYAGYVRFRAHPDRAVRERVFDAFWRTFATYQSTLGTLLNAEVQKNWYYAAARHYPSTLAATMDALDMPESVYTNLIRDVRANLPTLHRALRLRQRLLGVDQLRYSDVYTSIVPAVDMTFPWEAAREVVADAMEPLGPAYVSTLRNGLADWVDVDPADGKQSGAYTVGRWYDGHPWVLLNYDDSYSNLSTAAHEFGHAMHSYYSNNAQPYPTSEYSGVVAEVASTFNEILLNRYLVEHETDPQRRLALLVGLVERMRQTVFRQTMFADFQLQMHRRAERGETLTGRDLTALYLELARKYRGQAEGVMQVDDAYGTEWAFISHFYMGYYVYQYATGFIAASALAEQVLSGDPAARDRYLEFLASGSSDDPVTLLKRAGADLTTSQPTELFMAAMNGLMDQIDALLSQQERS